MDKLNKNGYYVNKDRKLVHRAVYEEKHGKIQEGWVVHHIDFNKVNNNIENLIALPKDLHNSLHDHMRDRKYKMNRKMLEQTLGLFLDGYKKLSRNISNRQSYVMYELNAIKSTREQILAVLSNEMLPPELSIHRCSHCSSPILDKKK